MILTILTLIHLVLCDPAGLEEALHLFAQTDEQDTQPRKPFNDKRTYRRFRLENGLDVLTVSDPNSTQASTAVAVEVGFYEDPAEWGGLAHFCEHMLFLGSKTYPEKTSFSKFMSTYGGTHNAYTSPEFTVYFNEITPSGSGSFGEVLDVFAHFFIDPLFDVAAADSERKVVHSEHVMNTFQRDNQRRRLMYSLASEENPISHFSTGNKDTLGDKEKTVSQALREFYNKNYVSGRMHLVLMANETLEVLAELAKTHFGAVPAQRSDSKYLFHRPTYFAKPAFPPKNIGKQILAYSGLPVLSIMLPLPDKLYNNYRLNFGYIAGYIFGNRGPKSLNQVLINKNLITSMDIAVSPTAAGCQFWIDISLTPAGAQDPQNIIAHFFAYVQTVRKSQLQAIVESLQKYAAFNFYWAQRLSSDLQVVSELATSMSQYKDKDILTGGSLVIDVIDIGGVEAILGELRPENMNYGFFSPDFNESAANHREQYYNMKYTISAITRADLLALGVAIANLDGFEVLPLQYVPDPAQIAQESALGNPENIAAGVWWHGASQTGVFPSVDISTRLSSTTNASALTALFRQMHVAFVSYLLTDSTFAWESCGVTYAFAGSRDGWTIAFSGYDQHIEKLMDLVIPVIMRPNVTDEHFERIKSTKLRSLKDRNSATAYEHGFGALAVLEDTYAFSVLDYLEIWDQLMPKAFQHYLDDIANCTLTAFFLGNANKTRATHLAQKIALLTNSSLGEPAAPGQHVLDVNTSIEVRMRNPASMDSNHAVINTYQLPRIPTNKDRVHMALISAIIEIPLFDYLRTEKKLGYVVSGGMVLHSPIYELRVLVMGIDKLPDEIDELIGQSIDVVGLVISNLTMNKAEFENRKRVLQISLQKRDHNMAEEVATLWPQIATGIYCFRRKQYMLQYLAGLNDASELLATWKAVTTPSKHKVSVKVFGEKAPVDEVGKPSSYDLVVRGEPNSTTAQTIYHGHAGYYKNAYICDAPAPAILAKGLFQRLVRWHHPLDVNSTAFSEKNEGSQAVVDKGYVQ